MTERKKQPAATAPKPDKKSSPEGKAAPFLVIGRVAFSAKQLLVIAGGAIILIALALWLLLDSPPAAPPVAAPQVDALGIKPLAPQPAASSPPTVQGSPGSIPGDPANRPSIKQIRLFPAQPTIADSLKVEVSTASAEPLTYTYQWKVNDRVIPDVAGDTLKLSPFRKLDVVTVTVTPYAGSVAGFAVESPIVAIHSAPPSLELKDFSRQPRKVGEPVELQLSGVDPDGDSVTFSLEDPHAAGMSIDSATGKITWMIQPDQKGTIRFGAAAADPDRTKVTKVFEITVE